MKRERSFQRKLLPIILLLAAVPLFLFSIVALVSLRSILVDRYEEQVESDLGQSEKLMNITLDRYEAVLDAAASDEEFLDTAQNHPGFIKAMWCGDSACEEKIKEETGGVKSRCIPFEEEHLSDVCVCCGKPARHMVYWGRQY